MLEHAVRALAYHPSIECTFVVLAPGDTGYAACNWSGLGHRVAPLYCGGPTRACSVFNALVALRGRVQDCDWILVHDAARPCLSRAELDRLVHELAADEIGGLLALPIADTIKAADAAGRVASTQPRDGLWRALTPQMFRYALLIEALHQARSSSPTDESAAIEALGLHPRLVRGAATNIKVTYPEDMTLAASILASRAEAACE
jgi:2-C-methyl-D-erythritol 4-phosphate cytidylyltransferase